MYGTSRRTINYRICNVCNDYKLSPKKLYVNVKPATEVTKISSLECRTLRLVTASTICFHISTYQRWRRCRTISSTPSSSLTNGTGDSQKLTLHHRRPRRILLTLASLPTHDEQQPRRYLYSRSYRSESVQPSNSSQFMHLSQGLRQLIV